MPVENSRRSGPGRGPVTVSNVPTNVMPGRADLARSKLPRYARSWSAIRAQLVRAAGPRSAPICTAIRAAGPPIWSAIRAQLVRDPRAAGPRSALRGPRHNRGSPRILARRSRKNARAGVLIGSRACAGFSRTISRKNNLKSRKKIVKIYIS